MIKSLHIENIAVVKQLDMDLQTRFTVLTGETGAGKSIILDSLNLLLGGRADRELIRTGESRGEVSAVFGNLSTGVRCVLTELGFEVSEGELMLSRALTENGSSARLNGRAIPLSVLKQIGRSLFNIHGQNDNQQLLDARNHISLLDAYADGKTDLRAYEEVYARMLQIRNQMAELRRDEQEQNRLCEMLRYQIADIDSVKPKKGEEEQLTELAKRLQSVEQITKCCSLVQKALQGGEKGRGAIYLTERAASAMDSITEAVPEAEKLSMRLQDVRYELEDIAEAAEGLDAFGGENIMERLDRTEARLDAIAKLQKKYGSTVEEVLAFREDAAARLKNAEHSEDRMIELGEALDVAEKEAKHLAEQLTARRKKAAREMTAKVTETLTFLDMPKVRFEVSVRPAQTFLATGCDEVAFMIATNPGEPLMPLEKIASGGELARIMLSLKNVLNECDGVDTVIFDEIDTGISGKTSRKVGIKLKEIGKQAQVLCVTHSAQIASLAHHQLYISKKEVNGRAETVLKELDDAGREEEIARILGGIEVTETQRIAAREMIREGMLYE